MSGYSEWLCAQDCYQPLFGGPANQMRFYSAGEVYSFPNSHSGSVPTSLFDCLSKDADAPEEVDPMDVLTYEDKDESALNPLDTINCTELQISGLAKEDIRNVGELRSCLETKEGEQRLLDSPHVRVGPATVAKWKSSLGLIKVKQEEE